MMGRGLRMDVAAPGPGAAHQFYGFPRADMLYIDMRSRLQGKLQIPLHQAYLRLSGREGYHWGMMRTAWASPAELAVMQFQDLLGLGSEARINTPSTLGNNWQWRALPGAFDEKLARRLYRETQVYQRLPQAKTSKK